jgi:hypothetical protein
MITDKCIRQIRKVREVAVGAKVAYVARSRISRLTLSLVQLVAKECGLKIPDRPSPISLPQGASEFSVELAHLSNRLLEASRTLCQPSEPLDERWRSGWLVLLRDLDELEVKLNSQLKYG